MSFSNTSLLIMILLCISCAVPETAIRATYHTDHAPKVFLVPEVNIEKLLVLPAVFTETVLHKTEKEYREKKSLFVTHRLYSYLSERDIGAEIVPLEEYLDEFKGCDQMNSSCYDIENLREMALGLNADTVLITEITRYTERKGSGVGVEHPASVSFYTELVSAETGNLLWKGYYSDTQRPLLHDVSQIGRFFKRGARWITADELASEVLNRMADDLSFLMR